MDYGIAALSTVTDKVCKELTSVHRAALLKATGCLACSQSIFVKLYKSLVLPTMDYGIAALSTVTDKVCKELTSVHRAALLKATRCLANSSTEAIEILTNCNPLHLHLRLRQAEELLRIQSKNDKEPIKEEFETSIKNQNVKGKKNN